MNQREQMFTNYYCLSVYTMRIAAFCLDMAQSYCERYKIKRTLQIAESGLNSRISDVTLKLKAESRNDILQDLAGDDLKALGSILHELVLLPSITDCEDELIGFIKEVKKIQNAEMERAAPGQLKEAREDKKLSGGEKSGEKPFEWPTIPKKEQSAGVA